MSNWKTVNKSHPCPICHGTTKCGYTDNAAVCHRVQSDQKRTDKYGHDAWLHRLKIVPYDELPESAKKIGRVKRKTDDGPFKEAHFLRLETGDSQRRVCKSAERHLGVEARAWESLDMRWCEAMKMAVVPMKSPDGRQVVGMNGRHFVLEDHKTPSHAKQNAEGSVDGLFIPRDLDTYGGKLVVCEGASDTAAALAMGMHNAIGRSSCRTGVRLVCELCLQRRIREVTVIADRDRPTPEAPEGVGMLGARELKAALEALPTDEGGPVVVTIRLPREGCKDLRDHYLATKATDTIRSGRCAGIGEPIALSAPA